MEKDKSSFTAMMVAYMRAYHSVNDTQKIFDDFLAYDLIPEENRALIEQYLIMWDKQPNDPEYTEPHYNQIIPSVFFMQATNVLSRARYVEDALEKAVKQGIKQYVILEAGMDTFAFRRPEMMAKLEVFEVDHPATQKFKLNRIAKLGWEHPAQLHFIPIDFTKENLATALTRSSSYDPNVKTFFSWLGVTMYLTQNEVFSTLCSITDVAPAGSTVVFDYADIAAFDVEKSSLQMQKKRELLRQIGEPIITGFNPLTLSEHIANSRLCLQKNLSPDDIERLYFQKRIDGYHAQKHGYIACAVVE